MDRGEDVAVAVVTAEVCPQCGSLDVRVVEPVWFAVELARGHELRDTERVEFVCRDCTTTWS
ncbi:MAG: hypothetical protein J0I70_15575 [Microbacterium sp.]|uniref:hypothetical protein n=1 Tax=Microbacterium sp. TaxID=51671 RepID=UPI001AC2A1BA|nr:hypothetical protein [Microbacterium sp.]MBN9175563.1 hypothetical protein [Microbacterium sp.]MBN9188118.1 hypothetical protein [Microbacterium sp.]MBN9191814.1 hypothetical protein [Microbacterium sp.]